MLSVRSVSTSPSVSKLHGESEGSFGPSRRPWVLLIEEPEGRFTVSCFDETPKNRRSSGSSFFLSGFKVRVKTQRGSVL